MKFYCQSQDMIEGLSITTRALAQRTTNPILENILIQTAEDSVIITCSNERVTIRTRIDARIADHGAGLVPGKLFNEIIRHLPQGEAEIVTNERNSFRITSGGSRTNVMGQSPDLFPDMPSFNEGMELTIPQAVLRNMIEKTEFAIAADDMREVLTGAYMEAENDTLSIVALDGFRMAVIARRPGFATTRTSAIIPGRVMSDLAKLLSTEEDEMVQLKFSRNRLQVILGETQLYAVLIDGEYVNYKQIIPKDFRTHVMVDAAELRSCIDRVALMARESNNNLVMFEISAAGIKLMSHSDIGDTVEELPAELFGDEIKVSFNVKYISDILKTVEADRVEMCLNTPVTPCIMRPEGDVDYFHLVLPIRT